MLAEDNEGASLIGFNNATAYQVIKDVKNHYLKIHAHPISSAITLSIWELS